MHDTQGGGALLSDAHGSSHQPSPQQQQQPWLQYQPQTHSKEEQYRNVHHPQINQSELYQPGQAGYHSNAPSSGAVYDQHVKGTPTAHGRLHDQQMQAMRAHQNMQMSARAQHNRNGNDNDNSNGNGNGKGNMQQALLLMGMGLLALLMVDAISTRSVRQ